MVYWQYCVQSQAQYDICIAPLTVLDSGAEQNKITLNTVN